MADQKQKVLSSKKILSSKLFDVSEDVLEAGNKKYIFQSVRLHPVAEVLPITQKKEVYLINQYRYMFGKKMLGIVAGMVDDGESPIKTAARELEEEAGIIAGELELLAKSEISRACAVQTHFLFLARDLRLTEQHLQDEEEIEVVKMPLKEAVEKVMSGEIYHSPSMAGILMVDKLRQMGKL